MFLLLISYSRRLKGLALIPSHPPPRTPSEFLAQWSLITLTLGRPPWAGRYVLWGYFTHGTGWAFSSPPTHPLCELPSQLHEEEWDQNCSSHLEMITGTTFKVTCSLYLHLLAIIFSSIVYILSHAARPTLCASPSKGDEEPANINPFTPAPSVMRVRYALTLGTDWIIMDMLIKYLCSSLPHYEFSNSNLDRSPVLHFWSSSILSSNLEMWPALSQG